MESVSINGVVQSEFAYNALGQQVIRRLTVGGQTIHSVHDADGNRVAEYNYDPGTQISTLLREYVWMNGENVAVVEGGVVYYVRTDHIGRPVFATDDSGTRVWEASYLPFGGVHTSTGANSDLRFPGQWFQSEAGLHQNWMRDYDPTTGRYIQADPLGLVDGASVYGYALQNPGRYVDPRGEQTYPSPPSNIPGGPWTPAGDGQKPGTYYGPKNSSGPRSTCRFVPDETRGGPRGAKQSYWKVKTPGKSGWQRYDLKGNPITPEQAHPKPTLPRPVFPTIIVNPDWFMKCDSICPRS